MRIGPRQNRQSWYDTWFRVAYAIADRSPDPSTQVGAVIVDEHNRIVSLGYNGLVPGMNPESIDWTNDKSKGYYQTKYPYICHAEANALAFSTRQGHSLFTTLFPCEECAKDIVRAGIANVIASDFRPGNQYQIACDILRAGNVHWRLYYYDPTRID